MAIASVAAFIGANDKSAGSSFTVTTSAQLSNGNVGVVIVALDNTQTTDGASTLVTSVIIDGQTVQKIVEYTNGNGTAGTGATVWVGIIKALRDIASGSNVVVSLASSTTAKAVVGWQYTVASGKSLAVDGTKIDNFAEDASFLGSDTITGAQNIEHLWVRCMAIEGVGTFTPTSTFTTITQANTTGSTADTNMLAVGEFKITTGTSSPTTNPDPGTASDAAESYIGFMETDALGTDNRSARTKGSSGSTTVSETRDSRTAGLVVSTSNRSARTAAKATTSDTRATRTTGLVVGSSARPARTAGLVIGLDPRNTRTQGVDTQSSARPTRTAGQAAVSSNRPARTQGINSASDSKSSRTSGKDTATSTRSARTKGIDTQSVNRSARTAGKIVGSSSRSARSKAIDTVISTRPTRTAGKITATSTRSARTLGQLAQSSTRSATTKGVTAGTSNRLTRTKAKSTTSSNRSLRTNAADISTDFRGARSEGFFGAFDSRAARTEGKEVLGSSSRSATTFGMELNDQLDGEFSVVPILSGNAIFGV